MTRSDRWMAWAGPAFLVLLLLGLLLGGSAAKEGSTGKAVLDHFSGDNNGRLIGVFLIGPAAALLLIFTARMAQSLEGAGARLFQYGAVVYATALLLVGVLELGTLSAVDKKLAASAEVLNTLDAVAWIPVVIGAAVMLLGGGLAILRTRTLPTWLGWVGVIVGVISLLGPGGFLGFFITPIWIAVAGVILATRSESTAAPMAATS